MLLQSSCILASRVALPQGTGLPVGVETYGGVVTRRRQIPARDWLSGGLAPPPVKGEVGRGYEWLKSSSSAGFKHFYPTLTLPFAGEGKPATKLSARAKRSFGEG